MAEVKRKEFDVSEVTSTECSNGGESIVAWPLSVSMLVMYECEVTNW